MIGELVSRLIAAGTPPELAAQVVCEAYAEGGNVRRHSADETAERRRAKDRDRKQKEREIRRQSTESADSADGALILTKSNNKRVRAKHPLSADWKPTEKHFEAAEKLHIPRSAVETKAEDLRIWAGSSGALKADWDLTFHGFLRRDAPKLAQPPPPKSTDGPGFYAPFGSEQLDAWDRSKPGGYPRDRDGGWRFPSEWPPEHERNAA
jgi:hypothetical protein